MWRNLTDFLACPCCRSELENFSLTGHEGSPENWIEEGLLVCDSCDTAFPIVSGLPVLLIYRTPAAEELEKKYGAGLSTTMGRCRFPNGTPEPGEAFVQRSFSKEWSEYDYDGVMWDLSYEDHEARFVAECGEAAIKDSQGGLFVEVGCGLGMSTVMGQKHLNGDAIGIDLGFAAGRATSEFKTDEHLHFVQASAFHLPLKAGVADLIYSHGVLHHTYNTEKAIKSVAPACKSGKWYYVWVYGPESLKGSPLRRMAWRVEAVVRPAIAKNLDSLHSRAFLAIAACGYLMVNAWHRFRDPTVQSYNFGRAFHAAQDRFTPLYAGRHDAADLSKWFEEAGFRDVEVVDWRTMPSANQDNYRRNSGVRGVRV